jgi:hypothetical protein
MWFLKDFFFEKKEKLFHQIAAPARPARMPMTRGFLVIFSKNNMLTP